MNLVPFVFSVDLVGTCNLRCPTCPIGNTDSHFLPRGAMPVDKLEAIVKKAKSELGLVSFYLYNWTEPFLYPRLGEAIRVVKRHGVACHLSTNLNLGKRIEEVAEAAPDSIRISISGFNQEHYGLTHKEGNVETVKQNMILLSEAVAARKNKTELNVLFHRYLGNHGEEAEMKEFAESHGYNFDAVWAYMMPLEKNFVIAEDGPDSDRLSDADRAIVKKLALPLEEAITISKNTRTKDCLLRAKQYALDSDANAAVCCAVYNSKDKNIGNFLEESHETLQRRKYRNPICKTCMKHGLHVLATYGPAKDFDRIATRNVKLHYPDAVLAPTRPTHRVKRVAKLVVRSAWDLARRSIFDTAAR